MAVIYLSKAAVVMASTPPPSEWFIYKLRSTGFRNPPGPRPHNRTEETKEIKTFRVQINYYSPSFFHFLPLDSRSFILTGLSINSNQPSQYGMHIWWLLLGTLQARSGVAPLSRFTGFCLQEPEGCRRGDSAHLNPFSDDLKASCPVFGR